MPQHNAMTSAPAALNDCFGTVKLTPQGLSPPREGRCTPLSPVLQPERSTRRSFGARIRDLVDSEVLDRFPAASRVDACLVVTAPVGVFRRGLSWTAVDGRIPVDVSADHRPDSSAEDTRGLRSGSR